MAHRLRRQIRRAADADAALRNEPRVIEKARAPRTRAAASAPPTRYLESVSLGRVREELDVLGEGFIYFIDECERRGKVLYVRQDGDYGLVEAPPVVPAAS